jgi:hypothetical protein
MVIQMLFVTYGQTSVLPDGLIGNSYNSPLTAVYGTTPYSWTISSGSLPDGLTLGIGTGRITGIPTTTGTFTFTVQVSDSASPVRNATKILSITVIDPQVEILADSPLPDGMVGSYYSSVLWADGGTKPYSWTISAGALPGGLNLNGVNGEIYGTPTTAGNFDFTAMVTDSSAGPGTDTKDFNVTIRAAGGTIEITTTSLPDGTIMDDYIAGLAATGGTPPYTWSIISGALPHGLVMDSTLGTIYGIPTVEHGTFTFTVQVKDNASPAETTTKELSININAIPVMIVTEALPTSPVTTSYNGQLDATGGTEPYFWSVTSGSLPTGYVLDNATGLISGQSVRPHQDYTFTITVDDSSVPTQSDAKEFMIHLTDNSGGGMPPIPEPCYIVTKYLHNGMIGQFYNEAIIKSETGKGPFGWAIDSGTLPYGLVINQDGTITGIPEQRGRYQFIARLMTCDRFGVTESLEIIIESNEIQTHLFDGFNNPTVEVHCIHVDSRDRKWIAAGADGVYMFEGDGGAGMNWTHYTLADMGLPGEARTITDSHIRYDLGVYGRYYTHDVWVAGIGADAVVCSENGGTWSSAGLSDTIEAYDMCYDQTSGSVWLAETGGAHVWDNVAETWTSVAGNFYGIARDNDGVLWLAGSENSVSYGFGKIEGITYGYIGTVVTENYAVGVAPGGNIWTMNQVGSLGEYDPLSTSWTGSTLAVGNGICCAVAFDANGKMWTKWQTGEVAKGSTVVMNLPTEEPIATATEQSRTITVDYLNTKWTGSTVAGTGLYRYTGD